MPDQTCLIATVKDEGTCLLEWVAHNRAIGFDSIVVASNDCNDGTDQMLDRLDQLGYLRHVPNPGPNSGNIQGRAYMRLRRFPEVANAKWLMALDVDEFLNIHLGAGRIQDLLLETDPVVDTIFFAWRCFGDAGHDGLQFKAATDTYTQALSPETAAAEPYLRQVKAICANHTRYDFISAHGGAYLKDPERRAGHVMATPSGRILASDAFSGHPVPYANPDQKPEWHVAQINHYLVKTRAHMMLRHYRGNVIPGPKYRQRYFDRHNKNEVEDISIQRSKAARRAILEELHADPQLCRLEEEARSYARQTLERIRGTREEGFP